jgi:Tfp pilus assembly protein FimV
MPIRTNTDALRLLVLRLAVLVVLTGAVFLLLTSAGSADEPPPPTMTYVVEPGDTLWDIAAWVVEPGADPRRMVDDIQDLNQLAGGTIQPGQTLRLPLHRGR